MSCDLIWLRRDLRLIDNDLFAVRPMPEAQLCVYVLEPRWLDDPAHRLTPAQWTLLWESLMVLRGNLLTRGSDLLVCVGEPERLLPPLMHRLGAERLRFHDHDGANEQRGSDRVIQAVGARAIERLPDAALYSLPPAFRETSTPSFSTFLATIATLEPLAPVTVALPVTLPPWPENGPRGLPSMESLSLPGAPAREAMTLGDGEDGVQRLLTRFADRTETLTLDHVGELLRALAIGSVSSRRLYALCHPPAGVAIDALPTAQRRLRHELLWVEYLRWLREAGHHLWRGAPTIIDPTGCGEPRYRCLEAVDEAPLRVPHRRGQRVEAVQPVTPPVAATGSWYDRY